MTNFMNTLSAIPFFLVFLYGGLVYYAWKLPKARWAKLLATSLVLSPVLVMVIWRTGVDGSYSFKEEVKLASGEQILVKRHIVSQVFYELGGAGGWDAKYNSMEIVSPKSADNPAKWESSAGLIPIVFDRDAKTGQWFLLAIASGTCDAWYKQGRPKLPYAEFQWTQGQWQQQPVLSEKYIGYQGNVFAAARSKGIPSLLTEEEKDRRNYLINSDEYKKIVSKWSTGC